MKKAKYYAKNAAKVGKELACEAKTRIVRELKDLLETRVMNKNEAKLLAKGALCEFKEEGKRILEFAKQEFEREFKKAKPHLKKVAKRMTKS